MEIGKGIFLGTGSAEGLPNPVCGCEACEMARKLKGRNVRGRSSYRLSEDIMIDFGPDFVAQTQKYSDDMMKLQHVLIPHTHYDHLSSFALCQFAGSTKPPKLPVRFYLAGDAFQTADIICNDTILYNNGFMDVLENHKVEFVKLDFFEKIRIGEHNVIPLPGRHPGSVEKRSANYLIECPDGTVIYYATDTGMYCPETMLYLKDCRIDILISECTLGAERKIILEDKHLSLQTLRMQLAKLQDQGTIGDQSKVYITHISHDHKMMYDELQQYVNGWHEFMFPIFISYDGMMVE